LPERKKPLVEDELQKLIAEWPTEVIKKQKKDDRKVRCSIFGSIPPACYQQKCSLLGRPQTFTAFKDC
jgi:hypothetical protein